MIGRFFYHAFWNFYDNLGTLTLTGVISSFLIFGSIFILSIIGPAIPWALSALLVTLLILLFTSLTLAALLNFTAAAARDETPRIPQLLSGAKHGFLPILPVILIWTLVQAGLLFNLWFYTQLTAHGSIHGISQLLLLGASGLIGWLAITWLFILPPWLTEISAPNPSRFFPNLKHALTALIVCPQMWLTVGLSILLLLIAATYLPFLLILLLPILTSLAHTAHHLTQQHYQFMAQASAALPPSSPIRAIKKKAHELTQSWEARQPRRTIKELFKPWQM